MGTAPAASGRVVGQPVPVAAQEDGTPKLGHPVTEEGPCRGRAQGTKGKMNQHAPQPASRLGRLAATHAMHVCAVLAGCKLPWM